MSDYPEHDKLTAVKDQTQAIGEFHEWLGGKGIFLATYADGSNYPRHVHGFRELLAEWAGIDENKLEAEKRQMLAVARELDAPGAAQRARAGAAKSGFAPVAEQEADRPEPVVWQCTYCWTEYEAMPSEQPPVCPECGPLHGPGARDAQPRIKPEPEAATVAASLVGTIVEDAADDSPVPLTGKVVRQVDVERVEVLWGDLQFFPNPGPGSVEPVDALRAARQQAGA